MPTICRTIATMIAGTGMLFSVGAFAEEVDQGKTVENDKVCFWTSEIRDFRAIDNRHVFLKGTGKDDQFLATLFQSCIGIRFADTIALESRPSSRICSNGNEHLEVIERGKSSFPRRCLIDDIERVESLDAARALVEERKNAKDDQDGETAGQDLSALQP